MRSELTHKDYYGDVTVKHVSDKLKGMKITVHDGHDESFPLTHHETNMINSIVNNHEAMKNMLDDLVDVLGFYLGYDESVDVSIGGNPTYIYRKLNGFKQLRARAKELQDEAI